VRSPFPFQNAVGGRVLDARQLAHRQRMFDHLHHASMPL
jgi:hypothetical protein